MSSRVRRKPAARTRLRLQGELVGIAALGFAVFFGIALALPSARAGFIGSLTAWMLHALFGSAAIYLPVLVALIGAIVFLEINVPQMIAVLGGAALGYFLIVCAVYGPMGGILGSHLWDALRWLFGQAGATIVIILSALALTVWVTNVSLKRTIGWTIKNITALVRMLRTRPAAEAKPQLPAVQAPKTLREAFNLPHVEHGDEPAPAPIVPVPSYTIVDTIMPPPSPTTIEPKVLHDSGEPEAMEEDDEDEDDYETSTMRRSKTMKSSMKTKKTKTMLPR